VSDPAAGGDPEAARRLAWFRRLGARVLEVPYVQPDLGAGLGRDRHLLLLGLFDEPAPASVDGARVSAFLRGLYAATEGPADDDEVRAMHAAIGARVALS
jgi:hypothetical protein